MKRLFFLLFLFCLCTDALAVRISDSGSSDTSGQSSTARSLRAQRDSLQVFNVAASIPVGTIVSFPSTQDLSPLDQRKWIECDGRSFSTTEYPELYTVLGKNTVPNLENMTYLRGSRTADVETVVQDTMRDHSVFVPEHEHEFKGHVTTSVIPGSAGPQNFSVDFEGYDTHTVRKQETLKNLDNMSYTRSWNSGSKSTKPNENNRNASKGEYVQGDMNTIQNEADRDNLFYDEYGRQCESSPACSERHDRYTNDNSCSPRMGRKKEFCTRTQSCKPYTCSKCCTESYTCKNCCTCGGDCISRDKDGKCTKYSATYSCDCTKTREIDCTKYETCYYRWTKWERKYPGNPHPSKSGQTYVTYTDNAKLSGPSGKGNPYADGYLEGTNVTGSVSQKTYSNGAWVNIYGKPVTGNSDSAYGEDGKMYPTDRNGNPISEMTAYYDTQSDSKAADETAPKTIYVRYFIRAEL